METSEIRTICLKHVYGEVLTETERTLIEDYLQTAEGKEYLKECREMKDLMKNLADVQIQPVNEQEMIQNFERTVRESFNKTVFRPWWKANSPAIILGLMAGLFILFDDGWSVMNAVLLGICLLWLITDYFQRYYFAKILSRPDLYEYAKASRRRSDRILQSLPGQSLVILLSVLMIATVSFCAYWGYQEFGLIWPTIVIFVLVKAAIIFAYQNHKRKQSHPEVWEWWTEEIIE